MSLYLSIKWLHILSSVLLVGTGFGSAFYFFFVLRSRNLAAIAQISNLIVRADWWFTTPAVIFQPLSGILMLELSGLSYSQSWIIWSFVLYLFAGACWIPVVYLQIQMKKNALAAYQNNSNLPPKFWVHAKLWLWLGYPAFTAMVIIYALMVFKP